MIINPYAFATGGGGGFDPLTLSPAIWLDASDPDTIYNATSGGSTPADGANVLRIEDKSGNGNHFTESTDPPNRATSVVNSMDAIYVDTIEKLIRTGGSFAAADFGNVFLVTKTSDTQYVFLTNDSGSYFADATESSGSGCYSGFSIGQFRVNGSNVAATRGDLLTARGSTTNILSITGLTSPVANWSALQINYGTYASSFGVTGGYFCELLIIPGTMTTGDRDDLEAYLINKWGI